MSSTGVLQGMYHREGAAGADDLNCGGKTPPLHILMATTKHSSETAAGLQPQRAMLHQTSTETTHDPLDALPGTMSLS